MWTINENQIFHIFHHNFEEKNPWDIPRFHKNPSDSKQFWTPQQRLTGSSRLHFFEAGGSSSACWCYWWCIGRVCVCLGFSGEHRVKIWCVGKENLGNIAFVWVSAARATCLAAVHLSRNLVVFWDRLLCLFSPQFFHVFFHRFPQTKHD